MTRLKSHPRDELQPSSPGDGSDGWSAGLVNTMTGVKGSFKPPAEAADTARGKWQKGAGCKSPVCGDKGTRASTVTEPGASVRARQTKWMCPDRAPEAHQGE